MTPVLQKMWADLNTPDAFRRDWYGGVTNQEAHGVLAARCVVVLCGLWMVSFGELPARALLIGILGAVYFAIEYRQLGATRDVTDAAIDTAFFMGAALIILVPIQEIEPSGHWRYSYVQIDWLALAALWIARDVALSCYGYVRAKRELREIHT